MLSRWRRSPVQVGLAIALAVLALATLALALGSVIIPGRAQISPAYALVDEPTLVVLAGQVEVQLGSGDFRPVVGDTIIRVGYHVRTGADSYGVITYFDGSSTALGPQTEIVVKVLTQLPDGGQQVSFHQEVGLTWNRVVRLVSPTSRFETTTASGVAFVRGTEYHVRVEADQHTTIAAVTDAVVVEAAGTAVELTPGFQTEVTPSQPPSPPQPAPLPRFALYIDVDGPVQPFLTDGRNRSVGFHPQTDAYTSQIPGATFSIRDGRSRLYVPDPIDAYELVLQAQEEGAFAVTVTEVRDGQEVGGRTAGLSRALHAERRTGSLRRGDRVGLHLSLDVPNRSIAQITDPRTLERVPGRVVFMRHERGTSQLVVRTAIAQSGVGRPLAPPRLVDTQTPTPSTLPTTPPTPAPSPTDEPTPVVTAPPVPTDGAAAPAANSALLTGPLASSTPVPTVSPTQTRSSTVLPPSPTRTVTRTATATVPSPTLTVSATSTSTPTAVPATSTELPLEPTPEAAPLDPTPVTELETPTTPVATRKPLPYRPSGHSGQGPRPSATLQPAESATSTPSPTMTPATSTLAVSPSLTASTPTATTTRTDTPTPVQTLSATPSPSRTATRTLAATSATASTTATATRSPTASAAPPDGSFTGVWTTPFGTMRLLQRGTTVCGTYERRAGHIIGTVADRTFTGTWAEAPTYALPNDAGTVAFTLTSESTVQGEWRIGTNGAPQVFNAARISPNTTETCAALTPTASASPSTTP